MTEGTLLLYCPLTVHAVVIGVTAILQNNIGLKDWKKHIPYSPRGVLAEYMGGGGGLTELCIANSKKYMSLKLYTQKKIPGIKIFYPKKYKTVSILIYSIKQTLRPKTICDRYFDPKNYWWCKFPTQKNTLDLPVMYIYCKYPPGLTPQILSFYMQGGNVCCFNFNQMLPRNVQSGFAMFGHLGTVDVKRCGDNSLVGMLVPRMYCTCVITCTFTVVNIILTNWSECQIHIWSS